MRKKLLIPLVLASVLAFAGCAGAGDNNTQQGTKTEQSTDTETPAVTKTPVADSTAALTPAIKLSSDIALTSNEAIEEARNLLWEEYLAEIRADETRKAEVDERVMYFGDVKMKYGLQVKGEPDENGYPLYIALHGGGSSDTPDINNSQWSHMAIYYASSVKSGIYINPRGVRDTWDTHANPESYPLYDRLIENMIAFYDVDPNRVYLVGFSAGGDGVYMITPKMTDRFAAANMSAGHPNGINLANLYNMPIQLQVGMLDTAYDRHKVTAEYDTVLDKLAETYGGGYEHNVNVHVNYAHNFYDNAAGEQEVLADPAAWLETGDTTSVTKDTNAIRYLKEHTRDALPERIVWDLSNRASMREVESFYWLSAPKEVTEGVFIASFDRETNTITIEEDTTNGPVSILISNDMLDVFSPIWVNAPDISYELNITPDYELLKSTTYERGDRNYQFVAKWTLQ